MIVGFEGVTGHVYEGATGPQFPVWPSPILSQVKLIESESDWNALPRGISETPTAWVFREDMFDPVTRVRRGRLYEAFSGAQPRDWAVSAHPFDHEALREIAAGQRYTKRLFSYFPCQQFALRGDRGIGTTLAIGRAGAASVWRVIQTELIINDDVLVTLKAYSTFGVLPNLDLTELEAGERQSVERAVNRVVDATFRETPISVIDHCRNAATVLLARWLVTRGSEQSILAKDLSDVAKAVGANPHNKIVARDAAEIIRRLHPRGKANEQEARGLRVPVEEDAELAIHALGFILREVGWAR